SSGTLRYVWTDSMLDGIPFVPAMIGLFALSEVLKLSERRGRAGGTGEDVGDMTVRLPWAIISANRWNILRSGTIGYIVGVIPGAGSSIASLVSYGVARRLSDNPERFGTGAEEGLIASETANNASVSGALAPMLALGLPGSASSAILIGALTIHGLQPGPLLFQRNPEIPYAIFASLLVGLPIMTLLGLFGGRLWIRLTAIPTPILSATVAAICIVGAYASSNSLYGVAIAMIFGLFGYLFRKIGIHPGPVVLALVLGELLESSFRRAVQISGGDYTVFVTSPIALGLLLVAAAGLLYPLYAGWVGLGRKQDA
ncbi:MAG: tripartite tricarboxylate transporter permease, partial [Erythrobacter sp.]|nr:tripartite tricarboxylate transporter permease [Erythrobacter sp.]